MMRQRNLYTILAAALAALAMTAAGQTTAPVTSDTRDAAQSGTEQDRLPASKGGTSTNRQSGTSANQSQAVTPEKSKDAQSDKSKTKHPPTAVMDRATPTQNAPNEQSARKHPPTSVMDSVTPEEKSPGKSTSE
jgi:hypothetical protein